MAWRRRLLRLSVLVGVMALIGLTGWPTGLPDASAHAVLVSSSPLDGATVATDPGRVTLTFDEPVGLIPDVDKVIDTAGKRADTGRVSVSADGATITMPLRPNLPDGTYTAVWRVVSADTHVVSGSITFGIGVPPGSAPAAVADHTAGLGAADDVAQGLVYAGLVLLLGLPAAAALFWPWSLRRRRIRLLVRAGWAVLVVGTVAQLVLQGARADNLSWSSLPGLPGLRQTLDSAFGVELLVRLAAVLALAPLMGAWMLARLRRAGVATLAAVPGAVVVTTVLLTGHAATGSAVGAAMVSTALHVLSMMLWLGGLLALCALVLTRRWPVRSAQCFDRAVAPTLQRWSLTAYACIAVLVITGEYQAWRQISPLPSLWLTRYGVILLIKVALVAAIVAVAQLSQRRVRAMAAPVLTVTDGPGDTTVVRVSTPVARGPIRAVRRAVLIEVLLAVLVLAATSMLVAEPPAQTTYGPPITMSAPLGPDHLSITVRPTRHGPQSMHVAVLDSAGRPAAATTMTVALSSPDVASLAVTMKPTGADRSRWTADRMIVPLAGVWTITVTVTLSSAEAYATSATYQVW